MSLLSKYLSQIRVSGQEPDEEIVSFLEKAEQTPASESDGVPISFQTECRLYTRLSMESGFAGERAQTILKALKIMEEACTSPLTSLSVATEAVNTLSTLDPPYTRKADFLRLVFAPQLIIGLRSYFASAFTGSLLSQNATLIEQSNLFFIDPAFQAFVNDAGLDADIQDIKARINGLSTLHGTISVINKLLPDEQATLKSLSIPDMFFSHTEPLSTIMQNFDKKLSKIEGAVATKVVTLLSSVNSNTLGSHFFIFPEISLLFKRPAIKAALHSSRSTIVANIIQSFTNIIDHVKSTLGSLNEDSHKNIIVKLSTLRQNRSILNSCSTNLLPFMEDLCGSDLSSLASFSSSVQSNIEFFKVAEEEAVRNARQLLSAYVKSIQGSITLFSESPGNGFSTISAPPNCILLLYMNQEKKLLAQFPEKMIAIHNLVTFLSGMGYDPHKLALPAEVISCMQLVTYLTPYVTTLQNAASFYNELSQIIRPYQKPAILKAAQVYDTEMQKAIQQSSIQPFQQITFDISSAEGSQDPSNPVPRFAKISEHIRKIHAKFKENLGRLDDFHKSAMDIVVSVSRVSLTSGQLRWIEALSSLRNLIFGFIANLPDSCGSTVLQYWTGCVAKVFASNYCGALSPDLSLLTPLPSPIGINQTTATLTLSPDSVKEYLLKQLMSVVDLPTNTSFHLSDDPALVKLVTDMRILSVNMLPQALVNVNKIAANLRQIETFLQKECALVVLSGSQNAKACAEKLQNLENCQRLADLSQLYMSQIDQPNDLITANLPFLIPQPGSEKNIYNVSPSNGVITVNIEHAIRLINKKPAAILDVAVSAASYFAEQGAEKIITECAEFTKRCDSIRGTFASSDDFTDFTTFFQDAHSLLKSKLKKIHEEMLRFKAIILLSSSFYENILSLVDAADASFLSLSNRLSNIESEMEAKKQEFWDVLVDKLAGNTECSLLNKSKAILAQITSYIQEFTAYCDANISVSAPENMSEFNSFFNMLFFTKIDAEKGIVYGGKAACTYLTLFKEIHEIADEIVTAIQVISSEALSIFNVEYMSMLPTESAKQLKNNVAIVSIFKTAFSEFLPMLVELEAGCSAFIRLEWSIVKNRLDMADFIQTKALACREKFITEITDVLDSLRAIDLRGSSLTLESMDSFKHAMTLYLTFISVLFTWSLGIFKILRSNSLTQAHYREIIEKTHLGPIIKHFHVKTDTVSASISDSMNGCQVLFLTAVSLFTNKGNISAENPQTTDYKRILSILREICTRAENETSIRISVEETSYWLTSEAKLLFTLHELTPLAQEELCSVEIGIDKKTGLSFIPLSAVWKHIFSQLVEKRAIISAVSTNPYSKSMKNQIDDCIAIIDSYTRLGHVMITISKQVSILEPVMGRKVLIAEEKKFYDSLRVLYSVILADCDDTVASECRGTPISTISNDQDSATNQPPSSHSVTLSLINIIKAQIPYFAGDLHSYAAGTPSSATDNTSIGPYKDVIITIELVSSLLSDIQASLRKYLEKKRILFPRFYFLADSDVLEILSTGSSKPEQTLRPHIKKLFSAIETLVFDKPVLMSNGQTQNFIKGFVSSEGEHIILSTAVSILPTDQPELWLNRFDTAHRETLRNQLLQGLKIRGDGCLKPAKLLPINELVFPSQNDTSIVQPSLSDVSPFDIIKSCVLVQKTTSIYVYSDKNFYTFKDLQTTIAEPLPINTLSGEMLCIAFGVMMTAQIDYALYKAKDAATSTQALATCKDRVEQYLSKFSSRLFESKITLASFGTPEFLLGLKIKGLLVDIYQYLNVLGHLLAIDERAPDCLDSRRWIWSKELKYRIHKESDDLYVFALDAITPYSYDYQGIQTKLVHTPLTSRCYNTISEAIALQLGGVLQGPAGTGKTESTKAFGGKLGRTVVCFNCDTSIERSDLSRLLIGIILSGSMGCFDEINRLDSSVLSTVATDIEAIQKVILLRSGKMNFCAFNDCHNINLDNNTFTLADIVVPISAISPYASIYVTMNPASREYRGRSELPFSLTRLLRGCFMGKADTSLIIETILSTSGFINSKVLAEKCDLSYLLCSRRIPKQVHLDWGLRSLQAILRQAAIVRASSFKDMSTSSSTSDPDALYSMESNVIIKCISDATLSRITGKSVEIFREILSGVFGSRAIKQSESAIKKFGAVSKLEDELVSMLPIDLNEQYGVAVLQLYRALTAKMGVALLGSTGSGKSYIFSLLKDAIYKLTKGNIAIQEFLIAPKSMSRQDLLGYVDPVTGEWNDGALSSTARLSVQILNNREIPCIWPVIVLDGSIDPIWIEALNSVLDDNRLLTMSSGERLRFPVNINPLETYFSSCKDDGSLSSPLPMPLSFLFETDSLVHASPATISRLAIIVVPDVSIDDTVTYLCKQIQDNTNLSNKLNLAGFATFFKTSLPVSMKHSKIAINVCTHMFYSGIGAAIMAGNVSNIQDVFVAGCMRSFFSEMKICVESGLPGEINEFTLNSTASILAGRSIDLRGTLATPKHGDHVQAPHFYWAVLSIKNFLAAGVQLIVTGPKTCGKHTALLHAASEASSNTNQQYKVLTLNCSQLTTRQNIVDLLLSECVETQGADGNRYLKPRGINTKVLLILRDCEIIPPDEFSHIETFTFVWSLVAHGRLYIKNGSCLRISDIQIAITTKALDAVPARLRRRMGIVFMDEDPRDIELVCGPELFKLYSSLTKASTSLQNWQMKMVSEAETAKLKAKSMNLHELIALPELLKSVGSLNLFSISSIKKLLANEKSGVSAEKTAKLLEIFLEVPIPYSQGKSAARTCLKTITQISDEKVLTYAKLGVTAQTLQKALQSDEGVPPSYFESLSLDLVTNKMRINLIKELVSSLGDTYNNLRLYYTYLNMMEWSPPLVDTVVHEYLKLLSAIEVSLMSSAGIIILSQPYNFSMESALVGALSTGRTILFAGTDHVTPLLLRFLGDKVARGHHNIAYFIDCNTLEADPEWYALLSALSSNNILYFRNRLAAADLRSLVATFTEITNVPNRDSMSEADLSIFFLELFVQAVQPIILLNPERRSTDSIFSLVPALRRNIQLISFELLYLDTSSIQLSISSDILNAPIKSIAHTLPTKTVSIISGASAASNEGKNLKPLNTIEQILKIASGYICKYITIYKPNSTIQLSYYTRIYVLYHLLKSKWTFMLNKKRERLSKGLKQLQQAQSEVDALAIQAQQHIKQVESSQEEANQALENISKRMSEANDRKLAAHALQKELSEKEQGIMKDKEQADAELSTVMPILQEATKAVQTIPSDALTEIKSFQSPPPAVSVVLEAVLVLLGHQDLSWKGMKAFLSQSGVLRTIANFDMKTASKASINAVNKVVKNNAECFEQERIRRVSRAAAPLAKWVQASIKYLETYTKMDPLMKAVENANRSLDNMRQEIEVINNEVSTIEAQIISLRDDFNVKTEQLVKYKQELQQIQAKQKKGQEMLHGLRAEKLRWEEGYKQASQQLDTIDKCAVNAAILFVVAGSSTDDMRESFFGCPMSTKDADKGTTIRSAIGSLLYDATTVNKYISYGLVASTTSLENTAIFDMLYSSSKLPRSSTAQGPTAATTDDARDMRDMRNYSLIRTIIFSHVTESTGVIPFLRNYFDQSKNQEVSVDGTTFVSATSENLANLVSIAARFGKTIVVLNCDNGTIPSALLPYIRCFYSSSENVRATEVPTGTGYVNTSYIFPQITTVVPTQSSKYSEMSPLFRMILVSSLDIFVPSDLSQHVLLLSYAPARKLQANLYIDHILAEWSPESLKKLEELRESQLTFNEQLFKIEQSLLTALSAATDTNTSIESSSIIDNTALMTVLKQAEQQMLEIQKAKEGIENIQKKLDSVKECVLPLALDVDTCVLTMYSLKAANALYIEGQCTVLPLLTKCLRSNRPLSSNSSDITMDLVSKAREQFRSDTLLRLQSSVFSSDVVAASALLLRNYCPDIFTDSLFKYFTGCVDSNSSISIPTWVPTNLLQEFRQVLSCFSSARLSEISISHSTTWSNFPAKVKACDNINDIHQLFPAVARCLTYIEMAAFVSACRKDLMSSALQLAVGKTLFKKEYAHELQYIDSIAAAIQYSTSLLQPVILYTLVGQDPTGTIPNSTHIAINPGQEKLANKVIEATLEDLGGKYEAWKEEQIAKNGTVDSAVMHTIIIKGAHLCIDWLSFLPSWLMETVMSFKLKYNEKVLYHVKIVLLLEPKPHIPPNLSRIAWRVCLTADSSPKEVFLDAIRRWPKNFPQSNKTESFIKKLYALLYISTALHIILDARRLYAPRGVALDPGWSQNDLTATISIIYDCMLRGLPTDNNENTYLLGFSNRLSGLLLDALYGVATKDPSDNALLLEFKKICYCNKIITFIFNRIDKGEMSVPRDTSVGENAQLYGEYDISSIINTTPVIGYLLPPIQALCNECIPIHDDWFDASQLINRIQCYIQQYYPEKPVPSYLGLPTNALVTQNLKSSITTRSLLARMGMDLRTTTNGGDGDDMENRDTVASVYETILRLSSVYEKEIKLKLTEFADKLKEIDLWLSEANYTDPATARVIPIIEELHLQGNAIILISKALESDFKEAIAANNNYLLATSHIKSIAGLVRSRILPERWCTGVIAVPCPTAPHDSPELVTLRSGDPFEYVTTFLTNAASSIISAYESCKQSIATSSANTVTRIELALSDMPRPAAFIEAIRRYEGIATGHELNRIKLVASSQMPNKPTYPVITLRAGCCILQGCSLKTLIDLNVDNEQLSDLYITLSDVEAQLTSFASVPFYVDQLRNSRMPGLETILIQMPTYSKEVDEMIILNGIYVHLWNR